MNQRLAAVMILVAALGAGACSEEPAATEPTGKIPVTSSSRKALDYFHQGRELADKIRFTDARDYFLRAIDEDPQFAMAYLYLANNSISAKEFFSSLKKAVFLSEEVSDGERLWILAQDAGQRGKPEVQREHLEALTALYPEDERAHNLLGVYYFGRQDYAQAIEHFEHATTINPEFSAAYNLMGYARRSAGDYEGAEEAFKKYVELIPDEPNPYDSYAELLMKMGRFDESIDNYRKALEKNPQFVFSYVGIGNNQIFAADFEAARETFAELLVKARNDGERRTAHFWTAVSHVFEGNVEAAVEAADRMSALAEAQEDIVALAGDAGFVANVRLHTGSPEKALELYARSVALVEQADVNDDVKETARRNHAYNEAKVAIYSGDLGTAAAKADEFRAAARAKAISAELRRVHELDGMLALVRGDAGSALAEFDQANAQDPVVLYWTAKAALEAGDEERALELAESAADFNQLAPNFAFVRAKAKALAEKLAARP